MRTVITDFIKYKSAKSAASNFVEENPKILTEQVKELFSETI